MIWIRIPLQKQHENQLSQEEIGVRSNLQCSLAMATHSPCLLHPTPALRPLQYCPQVAFQPPLEHGTSQHAKLAGIFQPHGWDCAVLLQTSCFTVSSP